MESAQRHETEELLAIESDISRSTDLSFITLFALLTLAVVISVGSVIFQSRAVLRPILALQQAAGKVATGDFKVRTNIRTNDEIGKLSQAFDAMATQLESSYALEDYSKKLEAEVKARTHDLEQKIADMEKLQQVMVNRELTMIELKSKLKEASEKKI